MLKKMKKALSLVLAVVCLYSFTAGAVGLTVAGSSWYTSGYQTADFVTNGKYAFVHVVDDLGHLRCSEIHVYDISDPTNITYVNKVYATFAPQYTQGWQLNEMTLFGDYLIFKMNVNAGMGYYGVGYLKLSDINPDVSVLPITAFRWTNGEATLKVTDKKIFIADPNEPYADLLNEYQIINGEIKCTLQDIWTADDHTVNAFRGLITNPKNSYALKLNSAGTGYEVYKDVNPFDLGTPIATLAMPSTGFAINEFEMFDNYIAAKTSGAATFNKNNGIHLYNLNNAANENGLIPESASKGYWDNSVGGRLQGMDSNGNLLAVMFQDGKKLDLLNFTTLESYSTIQPANITPYGGYPVFAGDKLVLGMCYGGINIYSLGLSGVNISVDSYEYDDNNKLVTTLNIQNGSSKIYVGKAMCATYDENHKLIDISMSDVSVDAFKMDYKVTLPAVTDGANVKSFLWDANMSPACGLAE